MTTSDVGIVVSIAAFQAVDPGSIPGHRRCLAFCLEIRNTSMLENQKSSYAYAAHIDKYLVKEWARNSKSQLLLFRV